MFQFCATSPSFHAAFLLFTLQVLERVVPLVDNSVIQATIKPCLTDLAEDPDVDVQFYARQALNACDNVQMQ